MNQNSGKQLLLILTITSSPFSGLVCALVVFSQTCWLVSSASHDRPGVKQTLSHNLLYFCIYPLSCLFFVERRQTNNRSNILITYFSFSKQRKITKKDKYEILDEKRINSFVYFPPEILHRTLRCWYYSFIFFLTKYLMRKDRRYYMLFVLQWDYILKYVG